MLSPTLGDGVIRGDDEAVVDNRAGKNLVGAQSDNGLSGTDRISQDYGPWPAELGHDSCGAICLNAEMLFADGVSCLRLSFSASRSCGTKQLKNIDREV